MLRVVPDPDAISFTHSAMATEFTFQMCGEDPDFIKNCAYEASLFLDSLERKLSLYQECSDISRINALRVGESTRISSETADCLRQALEAAALFKGRFNPFIGRAAIRSKEQESDFDLSPDDLEDWNEPEAVIGFDPAAKTVERLKDGYMLDLGAIGKGFALDQIAEFLEDWDSQDGLLNSGGSTLLLLPDSNSDSWKIEYTPEKQIAFPPRMALASSGLHFQSEHIINPRTGTANCLWNRVHALAPSATLADAASTAAMLLTEDQLEQAVKSALGLSFLVQSGTSDKAFAIGTIFKELLATQQ